MRAVESSDDLTSVTTAGSHAGCVRGSERSCGRLSVWERLACDMDCWYVKNRFTISVAQEHTVKKSTRTRARVTA